MNAVIKTTLIIWFAFCAVIVWFACMILGFILAFTPDFGFMYDVTPFIGLTSVICIIKCVTLVNRSNPMAYIDSKIERIGRFLA